MFAILIRFCLTIALSFSFIHAQTTAWSAAYTGATLLPCPHTNSNFTLPVVSSLSFSQASRGAGISCASITSGINSTAWNATDAATAIAQNEYYEISINSFCPVIQLDSIRYSMVSSVDGPTRVFLMVSVNGSAFVPFGSEFAVGNLGSSFSSTVSGPVVNVSQGGNLRIRFFAHSAASPTGSHAFSNNTVVFLRTTEPSASMSGSQTICSGNAANMSINFTGSGPWDIIWSDGFNNSSINGINTNPYILTLSPSNSRTYSVVSVVSLCSGLVSGNHAVNVTPSIGNNLVGPSQTLCVGNTTALYTGSTPFGGTGVYVYQWQLSSDQSNWIDIGGANGINFNAGTTTSSFYFRRVVTSGVCPPSTSAFVNLIVLPAFSNNTISANQTVCAGGSTNLMNGSLPLGGANTYTFQWQSSSNNVNFTSIPGAVTSNYTHPLVSGNTYFRRIALTSTCTPITSASVAITTLPGLGNNFIGTSQAICVGSLAAPFTGTIPTGGNGSYNYQWESSTDNINYFDATPGAGVGYSAGMILTNTYFRRIVSSTTCPGVTSLSVFIRPDDPILDNFISPAQTLCAGSAATTLTGTTPTGGFGGFGYQWQTSTNSTAWTNVTAVVTPSYNPGTPISSLYYRRIVSSGACVPNTSAPLRIEIEPAITGNTLSASQTLCAGSLASALNGGLPSGGNGFYAFSWQSSPDGFIWNTVTGEVAQNFSPFFPAQTVRYRRLVTSGVCPPSTSTQVILTVQQNIGQNIIAPDQTLCAGNSASFITGTIPTGGGGAYVFQWLSSNNNITYTPIIGANLGNYFPGVLQTTTYYRRTASSGICAQDTSFYALMDVYPVPSPNVIGNTQTLCGNPVVDILTGSLPGGGLGGMFYEWLYTTDSVNWLPYPLGNNQDLSPDPLTLTTWFTRVVTSGTCDPDTAAHIEVIYWDAAGNNQVSANQTICAGFIPALATGSVPSGGSGTYVYQWESSQDSLVWNAFTGASQQDFQPPIDANDVWYRRIVDFGGSCAADSQALHKVSVLDPPSAVLTGDQSICDSYSAQLSVTLSGSNPPWNFSYLDGISTVTVTGITESPYLIDVTPLVHTTYSLLGVNDVCPGFFSGEPVVIVHLRPWAVLSNDQTICVPGQAIISVTMYGPGPWNMTYTNGVNLTTINGINTNPYILTVNPTATTSYRLTELNDGRCSRTDHPNSSVVTTYNAIPPNITFSYARNANTVWFTNNSTGADTYLWDFGDGNSSTLKNPYHYYFFNGNYQVKLVGYNACGADSVLQVVTSVSVDDAVDGIIADIYPNPVEDLVFFKLPEILEIKNISCISADGREVYRSESLMSEGNSVYSLKTQNWASGVYMIRISTDSGILTGRMIKR